MAVNEETELGCGRQIDDVWDRIEDPPDEHELTCPDCRAARASLDELSAATRELVAVDAADTTLRTSSAGLTNIMAVARAEVRRGRRLPLRQPLPDQVVEELTISEQAVAAVIRQTADRMPGIEAGRCRVEFDESVIPAAQGEAATIKASLRVRVAADLAIPVVVQALRDEIIEVVLARIGIRVSAVDVVVEDVFDV